LLGETSTTRAGKRDWPKRWKSKKRHKHVALSDAIEQGESFMKMLMERLNSNLLLGHSLKDLQSVAGLKD
jgi:hypothetical protein